MKKTRELPRTMSMPTHDEGMKPCIVATSTAIHTVELPEGHFAALVFNQPRPCPAGMTIIVDREEAEAIIATLLNAIDDAERLARGLTPAHAAHSLTRQ